MLDAVNNSKLFLGIMMIVLNIGSRHLVDEFSGNQEEYQRNLVLRRVAIFAVCFVATHDIVTSLLLTAGFIIIATGISLKNREGMANQGKPAKPGDAAKSKADQPAFDTEAPLLFKGGK
jgi:hypothetical protein